MPHATNETSLTNGDKNSSQFINHLTSYPVVSDGIETFKSNPYGKKSIEIADGAYQKFGKPVEPYLETPYSYAKPYLNKADELGDKGLGRVEGTFPIMKEDTNTIVDTAKSYILWPFKLADDGKTYVFSTWNDEYDKTAKHKNRGPGVSTSVMALVSTELRIASDCFHAVANFLGPKYEESKKKGADYVKVAQDNAEHYKQVGQEKLSEYQKFGQEKVNEFQKNAPNNADEAKKMAQDKGSEAQKVAQDKAGEVQKTAQDKGEHAKKEMDGAKEETKKKAQK